MPIIFIDEMGLNHNGNIDTAKKLITEAKETSCNAVKFKKRTICIDCSKEMLSLQRENLGKRHRENKKLVWNLFLRI